MQIHLFFILKRKIKNNFFECYFNLMDAFTEKPNRIVNLSTFAKINKQQD